MGIRIDFLIKHVRPTGNGFSLFNRPDTKAALDSLGIPKADVATLLQHWAVVADLAVIPDHESVFAENAVMISNARWTELFKTGKSTVVYLNGDLLEDLSAVSATKRNTMFDWRPKGGIPVEVTINRKSQACTTHFGIEGLRLKADGNGMCYHLEDVLED